MPAFVLFLANVLLLLLLYYAIFRMVQVVRREMATHVEPKQSEAPAAQLRVVAAGSQGNANRGQTFRLHNMTLIGNNPDNDICLRDGYVSGKHAMIRWRGSRWTIEDLGSTNGTLLNGRSLIERQPQPLNVGDSIVVGDFTLEMER